MKTVFKVLIILFVLTSVSFAQTFMNISAEPTDSFNAILVEKSGKWMHVLKISEGRTEVLQTVKVLTGGAEGDKVVRGDEKTPEGLYFVTGFISPAKLKSMYGDISKQYGTGAYPLSYPNLKDRLAGKTGGGIWLHGVSDERSEVVTKGCVAMENDKLSMLSEYITVGTPVVITNEGIQGAVDQIREHFNSVKQIVTNYIDAWENNDFDSFQSYYHAGFKSVGGRNFASYLAYKKNLMEIFPYRKVYADNFRIFSQTKSEAVAEFDQYYCAPNVYSYGTKRFYFESELDGLKIVSEEFIPKDGRDFVRSKVNEFLIDWKNSWEGRNADEYISFYSDKFKTRGMDKAGWKADKAGKFETLTNLQVAIENIAFKASSPVSYTIEFRQKYTGNSYKDIGIKTLKLEGCPGDFKIVSENWRAE
ncbi:MAG: hypothetical protein C0603_07705 [Denitrovibrio sp.]|nr:MAG: hypothetical protein C0603_07705 [Denitrovibrio sp.]